MVKELESASLNWLVCSWPDKNSAYFRSLAKKVHHTIFMHYPRIKQTQSTGFEPVLAEPNGSPIHHLNHSAITAQVFQRPASEVVKVCKCLQTGAEVFAVIQHQIVTPLKFRGLRIFPP